LRFRRSDRRSICMQVFESLTEGHFIKTGTKRECWELEHRSAFETDSRGRKYQRIQ
jgi:hypothetical protein